MEAVYVLTSPLMKDGRYKIGYSTQGLRGLRARYGTELGEVNVKYYHEFRKYNNEERVMHGILQNYRIWSNREWFKCPYSIIDYNLAKLDGRYNSKCKCLQWLWNRKICIVNRFTPDVKTSKVDYID